MTPPALLVTLVLAAGATAGPAAQQTVYEIEAGVTPPRVVHEVRPEYPGDAKAERKIGTVVLSTVVGVDGVPGIPEVKTSVDRRLDEAAASALARWRFEPGTREGQAVPVRVEIEFTFSIR